MIKIIMLAHFVFLITFFVYPDENKMKFGFIDKTGKKAIVSQYDDLTDFHEGLAGAASDGKYGFIDKTGKMKIKPQFEMVGYFSEDLVAVKIDGK